MTTDTQRAAVAWHVGAGGRCSRLAGHALRLLNEAVELCAAAGASPLEIETHVHAEIAKALERGEFSASGPIDPYAVRKELVDVQILGDVLAHWTGGVDTEVLRAAKIMILHERDWEAAADGALWRPGRAPR